MQADTTASSPFVPLAVILTSMNRRDAIDPRRLAPVAAPFLALPDEPAESADPDAVVLRFARQAMATTFEVVLPFGTPSAHDWAIRALDEIEWRTRVHRRAGNVRDGAAGVH